MIMRELESRGVRCFTSSDYENAFSIYRTPGIDKVDFKRRFDVVCLCTDENAGYIDKFKSENSQQYREVVGADRDRIEGMVRNLLDAAHRSEIKTRGLPTVVEDRKLRPYQSELKAEIIEEWQREPRLMLQMPTGTGKTRLFVSLINDIHKTDPSARILIVTHRRELVEQTSRALSTHYRLPHEISGGREARSHSNIQIASIQRLSRLKAVPVVDYIIIDEAHHCLAPSYKRLVAGCPSARILGVTATPCRLRTASFKGIFGRLLLSPSVRRFINDGYLADYRLFTVSDGSVALNMVNRLTKFGGDGDYKAQDLQQIVDVDSEIEKLYEYYEAFANGKRGIVYAVSRSHAARIAALFNSHGVDAVSLDCDTPPYERIRIVNDFKSGRGIKVLVNVELFTEGFDCPDIEFVMLARPTRSLAMYLQQVGRALRPSPNGSKVIVLDAAGLYNRFGSPERKRDWQSHFMGERPRGEDYDSRPLGTPGIGVLMKEITGTHVKPQVVNTYGDYSVCDFGGCKFGVCDNDGRRLFPLSYKAIKSYADGWFVGERRGDGSEFVVDILVPGKRSARTFVDFIEEGDGLYSVGVSMGRRLRFDNSLRLIQATCIDYDGIKVYRHGEDKNRCLYTLSLTFDSEIFTTLTRYVSGMVKLTGTTPDNLTFIYRGEIFRLPKCKKYDSKHFYSNDGSLHIITDGTIYRRIADYPVLYRSTQGNDTALCDKSLRPLCHGEHMETAPGRCIIYKGGRPLQTLLFVEYLCGENMIN